MLGGLQVHSQQMTQNKRNEIVDKLIGKGTRDYFNDEPYLWTTR